MVVVDGTSRAGIEVGDVVTFRRSGAVGGPGTDRVTHRVVDVVRTGDGVAYRTRGDANDDPETTLVEPSQVVGEVWFHVPYVGRLVLFARTTTGLALLVVAPGVLLLVSGLRMLYESIETGERDD